jgi:hypothetical protein
LSDGSKPRWTIDVPNKLLGMKNGKGTSEIKLPTLNFLVIGFGNLPPVNCLK